MRWPTHSNCTPNSRVSLKYYTILTTTLKSAFQTLTCHTALHTLLREAHHLSIPIADHKTEGPTTKLTYLGIEIDTLRGEPRLPHLKLQRLHSALLDWGDRKVCSQKELESLIRHLNHSLQDDIIAVEAWCRKWNLSLNSSKCCAIRFTLGKCDNGTYVLNNTPIKFTNLQRDLIRSTN